MDRHSFGWGVAVMVAVYAVGRLSGAHLNPAVTVALASIGAFQWSDVPGYVAAQMVGAVAGAVLVWLVYLPHWPVTQDANLKLAVFCTGPAIRKPAANLVAETIATAAFVFAILAIAANAQALAKPGDSICPLSSAAGCSRCLSEVWCWALDCRSAARPAMPSTRQEIWAPHRALRAADSRQAGFGWGYAWIPIVGPIVGGVIGAQLFKGVGF